MIEGVIGERRRAERRTMPAAVRRLVEDLRIERRRPGARTFRGVEYRAIPVTLIDQALTVIVNCYKDDP